MALTPNVIDVPLSTVQQSTAEHQGRPGALSSLLDCVVEKWEGDRKKVRPRPGFRALVQALRKVTDGTASAVGWSNPELLAPVGDQLVSICNHVPRVYNGATAWSAYDDTRVLPNKLGATIVHTGNHTMQAPDNAWLAGVTCHVWTETTGGPSPTSAVWIAFRSDDGAWVRQPQLLVVGGNIETKALAKVVSDGTQFWVFWNLTLPGPERDIRVQAYGTDGTLLGDTAIGRNWASPGYWDVTFQPGIGVCLAQPHDGTGATDGADVSFFTLSGGSISEFRTNVATVHCRGPVAWLTNDLNDGAVYLASIGRGAGSQGVAWAYRLTVSAGSFFQLHEYPVGTTVADYRFVDSIPGWVVPSGTPAQPTLFMAVGILASLQTSGPPYDPARRTTQVVSCAWSNAVTQVKQVNSVVPASRAFQHDGEYYGVTYYQSGSGLTLTPQSSTVAHTAGDYFLGARVQPVRAIASDRVIADGVTLTIGAQPSTSASTTQNITGVDTVVPDVPGPNDPPWIPAGTPILRWRFANIAGLPSFAEPGEVLRLAGSTGVASANGDWDVYGSNSTTAAIITPRVSRAGAAVGGGGTFGAAGTAQIRPTTFYSSAALSDSFTQVTAGDLKGGTIAMSGSQVILRAVTADDPISYFRGSGVWVDGTTPQTGTTGTVTPPNPGEWHLTPIELGGFDSAVVGSRLIVQEDTQRPTNDGNYAIVSATPGVPSVLTTDATTLLSEIFTTAPTAPRISVQLADNQVEFTFKLQALTLDYSLIGAYVVIQAGKYVTNNGVYKVRSIDVGTGTFVADPVNGASGQQSENLQFATVTVIKAPAIISPWQPAWFLTPFTGTRPQVGCFELLQAYADWRIEGDGTNGPSRYPMALASIVRNGSGWQVALPYRAQSVTVATPLATATAQVPVAETQEATTVGLKLFTLADAFGTAVPNGADLLLPGPMGAVYDGGGFLEAGISLGLEAPYLVSQGTTTSGQLGLTAGQRYQVMAVAEYTTDRGDRIFSRPSPPLDYQLTGANNKATYGGRLPMPLSTTGASIAGHVGVTCRLVAISLYRTAVIGDADNLTPTTIRYKITDDLNVNGLAPASALNASGFSFPDEFTWQYIDANPDVAALAGEQMYTDKGFAPRFPMPPASQGVTWLNRVWVIAYDGAVWFSAERSEGDATWWFPGFRIPLPNGYTPLSLVPLEGFLLVVCREGFGYIPAQALPDAAAQGNVPNVIFPPRTNGGTGAAIVLNDAAAYASTAGGIWVANRALQNAWLTKRAVDDLAGKTVTAMAVDARQRLHILCATGEWFTWDQLTDAWSQWRTPTAGKQMCVYRGQVCYQDGTQVMQLDPTAVADFVAGSVNGAAIAPDVTFQRFSFAEVRAVKSLREIQGTGVYLGPHQANVVISYPDDGYPNTAFAPYTPDPSKPYLWIANPALETAASWGLRVYATFTGITSPGLSFELELVSFEVGVDRSAGIIKLPDGFRMQALP